MREGIGELLKDDPPRSSIATSRSTSWTSLQDEVVAEGLTQPSAGPAMTSVGASRLERTSNPEAGILQMSVGRHHFPRR